MSTCPTCGLPTTRQKDGTPRCGRFADVRLDELVLPELKKMRRQGHARASVKELTARIGCAPGEDS